MMATKPIVIVDDDADDIMIFHAALIELKLDIPIFHFLSVREAFEYLRAADELPGLIISDMHLPASDGLELRRLLRNLDRFNSPAVPFIILSTGFSERDISLAHALQVQGLFTKEATFARYVEQLECILKYWSCAVTPPRDPRLYPWVALKGAG